MKTINPLQHEDPGNSRHSTDEPPEAVSPYQHDMNIADGGEFLDDALRMKDQPLDERSMDDLLEDDFE